MKEFFKYKKKERENILRGCRNYRSKYIDVIPLRNIFIEMAVKSWFKLSFYERLRVVRRFPLYLTPYRSSGDSLEKLLILHPHVRLYGSGKKLLTSIQIPSQLRQ